MKLFARTLLVVVFVFTAVPTGAGATTDIVHEATIEVPAFDFIHTIEDGNIKGTEEFPALEVTYSTSSGLGGLIFGIEGCIVSDPYPAACFDVDDVSGGGRFDFLAFERKLKAPRSRVALSLSQMRLSISTSQDSQSLGADKSVSPTERIWGINLVTVTTRRFLPEV